ncbi:hypothetical protein JIQ42_05098 [Leishmania sp. Namibia]|uniref:hypothetical protein n=1 Tax=Leishmania sp. Namibia TaxID=2802991 RepID=UPI001B79CF5F|nr:hypothetical protein JIQ42_05098 [Leishmania sp. Namibia]
MNQYDEIMEADKIYLEKVGMQEVLQQFVADTMETHPDNIYEYMMTWATMRRTPSAALAKRADVNRDVGEYPVPKECTAASDHEEHRSSSNRSSLLGARASKRARATEEKPSSPMVAAEPEGRRARRSCSGGGEM